MRLCTPTKKEYDVNADRMRLCCWDNTIKKIILFNILEMISKRNAEKIVSKHFNFTVHNHLKRIESFFNRLLEVIRLVTTPCGTYTNTHAFFSLFHSIQFVILSILFLKIHNKHTIRTLKSYLMSQWTKKNAEMNLPDFITSSHTNPLWNRAILLEFFR